MPNGVESVSGKLRVYFRWAQKLHREPLGLEDTPGNRLHAEQMVSMIRYEIQAGRFDYARWFPKSKSLEDSRLGRWIDIWLEVEAGKLAPSTLRGYRAASARIRRMFGDAQPDRLDRVSVEQWIANELSSLSSKTIRDTLSVFSQVFELFRARHPDARNPIAGIKTRLPDDNEPDPFSREEINLILNTPTKRVQELALVQFLLWSGCRVSEGIALAWDDVDLARGMVRFRRAKVRGQYRVTKTRRSDRAIQVLPPALSALLSQQGKTAALAPVEVPILQRDNRSIKQERHRFVFLNSNTGRPFFDDFRLRDRFFRTHLLHAGVRYRGPGQCRHTFASQALTAGAPTAWILDHLGHTSERMLLTRYAKWIPSDAGGLVEQIAQKLGI